MATVLALVQGACYQALIPAPTALVGSTEPFNLQLLHLFYEQSRYLRGKRWWPQLKRTFSLTLVNNQANYQLPQDFYCLAIRTNWDTANRWEMMGPMSDTEWNYRLYGYVTIENRKAFRVFGPDSNPNSTTGMFYVNPTPGAAGGTVAFDYISKTYIFPPNWAPSTAYSGTIYRNCNGNIYVLVGNGTSSSTTGPSATSGNITDGTCTWNYVATPYEAAITDSDLSLFDDDLMIQGLKWRFMQARGTDQAVWGPLRDEHDVCVDEAVNRWTTGKKITAAGSDVLLAGLFPYPGEGSFG